MVAFLISLVEKIAHGGEFDSLGDVVTLERRFGPLSLWSVRNSKHFVTGVSLKLRKWHKLYSQTRLAPLAVCVECGAVLMEEDAIPDHEWVLECPKCGHPNDNPAWRD